MTDLYEILGVERGADAPAIRAAYRRRAKQAHPDAGGTVEQFETLNRAKLVLLDPRRRREYDATGKIDESADDAIAKTLNMLVDALDEVLGQIEQRRQQPRNYDLIADTRKVLVAHIAKGEQHIAQSDETIATLKDLIKRFHAKKGKTNRLSKLFDQRLRAAEQQREQNKDTIMVMKDALTMLDDHKFDWEHAAPQPTRMTPINYFLQSQW